MLMIHWGFFLGSLFSLPTEGISIIFGCIFEFSFALLASWQLHREIYIYIYIAKLHVV